jgi:hypothetical protein
VVKSVKRFNGEDGWGVKGGAYQTERCVVDDREPKERALSRFGRNATYSSYTGRSILPSRDWYQRGWPDDAPVLNSSAGRLGMTQLSEVFETKVALDGIALAVLDTKAAAKCIAMRT